jgi:hypothetical protein
VCWAPSRRRCWRHRYACGEGGADAYANNQGAQQAAATAGSSNTRQQQQAAATPGSNTRQRQQAATAGSNSRQQQQAAATAGSNSREQQQAATVGSHEQSGSCQHQVMCSVLARVQAVTLTILPCAGDVGAAASLSSNTHSSITA